MSGLPHLGMSFDDGHAPRAVRLFGVGPEKVMLAVGWGVMLRGLDGETGGFARRDRGCSN